MLRVEVTQMPDEKILREKARVVVRDGKLPSRRPDRTWGGPGVGAPCAVCVLPVERNEIEFEIQFARDGDLVDVLVRECGAAMATVCKTLDSEIQD